ncbi:MAG: tetratricopeptide repeat protein [Verrucomicrobiota bacterium]|nr:tetratricopeptide repeat protein [Limisphaera sp.]MDW8381808.1 tetratricopeptide repeat protein [Verrucomicrobiota bacterium]
MHKLRVQPWVCVLFWALGAFARLHAQGPDQQFVTVYAAIQEGDRLLNLGQSRAAIAKYLEAQEGLRRLQAAWPDWNPRIVRFRLNYLADRIAQASAQTTPSAPLWTSALPPRSASNNLLPPTLSDSPLLQEIEGLKQQVAQLQSDKALLEARLREALSVQPVATDPRELGRAQARMRELEKEVELLRVALEEERSRKAKPELTSQLQELRTQLEEMRRELATQTELARRLARDKAATEEQLIAQSLAAANELRRAREQIAELEQEITRLRRNNHAVGPDPTPAETAALEQQLHQLRQALSEQTERAAVLAEENQQLQARLAALGPNPAPSHELEQLRQALTESQRLLTEQQELNRRLASDKADLEARLARARLQLETLEILRDENRLLKQQLASKTQAAAQDTNSLLALRQTELQLATLQSDLDLLRLEKAALEQRLQTARNQTAGLSRTYTETIANLRARIAALEAQGVPFTAEELALLRPPDAFRPASAAGRSTAALSAAAVSPQDARAAHASASTLLDPQLEKTLQRVQQALAQGQYEAAAQLGEEVLQQAPLHPEALDNMARACLQLGRLMEAEAHAHKALQVAPDRVQPRLVLGQLYLRQGRYDEAVDAFSRAAEMDSRNPEIQTYLGLALSYKGFRAAAETALRRAILLQPGYAAAHHNLAVFYLRRSPPLLELARWHYQKARSNGFPANPDLETALGLRSSEPAG